MVLTVDSLGLAARFQEVETVVAVVQVSQKLLFFGIFCQLLDG